MLLVAPCTANVLAKFAHGVADDFLSSLYLATTAPVLLAPGHEHATCWRTRPCRRTCGSWPRAACGSSSRATATWRAAGWARAGWRSPTSIVEAAERVLAPVDSRLRGRRVLVTAGPTLEDIDPVRFVGNRSSGRMGFAVAEEALRRGAEVTLVAGPTSVPAPAVQHVVRVRSAAEMHEAVMARAADADVVIMAAAVADYTPGHDARRRRWRKATGRCR